MARARATVAKCVATAWMNSRHAFVNGMRYRTLNEQSIFCCLFFVDMWNAWNECRSLIVRTFQMIKSKSKSLRWRQSIFYEILAKMFAPNARYTTHINIVSTNRVGQSISWGAWQELSSLLSSFAAIVHNRKWNSIFLQFVVSLCVHGWVVISVSCRVRRMSAMAMILPSRTKWFDRNRVSLARWLNAAKYSWNRYQRPDSNWLDASGTLYRRRKPYSTWANRHWLVCRKS